MIILDPLSGRLIELPDALPPAGALEQSTYDPEGDGAVAASESLTWTRSAGAGGVGGQRAVMVGGDGRILHASAADTSHADRVAGITTGAANENGPVTVMALGEMEEPSWSWIPGLPVYLGLDGLLTQSPPTSGQYTMLGMALSATRLAIFVRPSILLA